MLLLGGYLYLTISQDEEPPPAVSERFDLVSVALEDLEAIEALREDGDRLVIQRQNGSWTMPVPWQDELDQSRLQLVARISSLLFADRRLDAESAALEDFGLKPPRAVVRFSIRNDRDVVLEIGSEAPSKTKRYIRIRGEKFLYTIDVSQTAQFFWEVEDFRKSTVATIIPEDLQYLRIRKKDEVIELVPVDSLPREPVQSVFTSLAMVLPYGPRGIDAHELEMLMEKLPSALTIQEFVEDDPVELAPYGLDFPDFSVHLRDNTKELSFTVGDRDSAGNYYARFKGETRVVSLAASDLSILEADSFLLMQKFPLIIGIDRISGFTVDHKDRSFTARIERVFADGKDEEEEHYFLEENEVKEKPFKALYQNLIGITGDAPNRGEAAEADPELSITYKLIQGPVPEVSVSFVPVDRDFYAAYTDDGESLFLVSARQIKTALTSLYSLVEE